MILVTVATGEKHRSLALDLHRSAGEWNWPRLVVASDKPVPVPGNVVRADDFGRGRGLKTRWAEFLPDDHKGPCAFIDCDCVVEGPWAGPELGPGEVAATTASKVHADPPFYFAHSTFVACGSVATARGVCREWSRLFGEHPDTSSDEQDLMQVLRNYRYVIIPSSYTWPLPNLRHIGATSGFGE